MIIIAGQRQLYSIDMSKCSSVFAYRVQPVDGLLDLVALACKHTLVQLDQLQEGLGCGVVVALLHLQDTCRRHAYYRQKVGVGGRLGGKQLPVEWTALMCIGATRCMDQSTP